ncbi:MAG: hypothetical protein HY582_03155, partial [Candidatus Omnitrophica bacterium]|nr:hypothetical protein [Candidatus Omnitrophota bacterium]
LKNVTRDFFEIEIRGPQTEILIRKLSTNTPKHPFTHFKINIKGAEQEKRFWILGKTSDREKIIALLTSEGEKLGVVWINSEVNEILRVESGIPKCGVDFNEETLLLETNLAGRTVSFTKGCYPGQEIVARMDSRKKSAKKLVWLRMVGEQIPKPGDPVQKDGKPIGKITSAIYSPKFSSPLALGYIASDFLIPNAEFEIKSANCSLHAQAVPLSG